ncbi:MAG TPA: hypothetical protein VF918_21320 [Anaerolineales bacterium]
MDNRPTIDRDILLPIFFGGFSIIGIIVVLLIGRSLNSPPPVSASPSATQFQYIYLGTEPAITTPLIEESEVVPVPTEAPVDITPDIVSPTSSISTPIILTQPNTTSTSTGIVLSTNTPSNQLATSTATLSTATSADTYDDTDARLAYSTGWTSQTGVSGAYQNTLHISNANGNSVTFTFTGQEIHVFYQAGPSLGSMTITIDNLGAPAISQAQNVTQITEWNSGLLTAGTHSIVITHSGGGSINIDSFVVPAPTVTPTTITPTRTLTPTP